MEAIMEVALEHDLYVIEDTAQAIGADYTFKNGSTKNAGTIGNIGTTSFFPSKNLGCYGDGGAIFTDDDELAHTIRGIVNHGMYKRYYHEVVGVNSRLDSIQAAILRIKLPYLDSYCEARKNAADYYNKAFAVSPKIITPITSNFTTHVFHQYTLRLIDVDRNSLHEYLNKNSIPNAIYYPVALHSQKAYQDARYSEDDFTNTNQLVETVISLPIHTEFDEEQQDVIINTILDFVN
jgi:dTDP-4-amino-4,6-dideoxygalactose transaminase